MNVPRPETRPVVAALFKEFKLPTAAGEMVRRLEDAGHDDALDVVREVLEAESSFTPSATTVGNAASRGSATTPCSLRARPSTPST